MYQVRARCLDLMVRILRKGEVFKGDSHKRDSFEDALRDMRRGMGPRLPPELLGSMEPYMLRDQRKHADAILSAAVRHNLAVKVSDDAYRKAMADSVDMDIEPYLKEVEGKWAAHEKSRESSRFSY